MHFGFLEVKMFLCNYLILRQWINLYLEYLKWIKNAHRNSVGPLVSKVSANPSANPFIGLPYVNRFPIIIIKDVNTPSK